MNISIYTKTTLLLMMAILVSITITPTAFAGEYDNNEYYFMHQSRNYDDEIIQPELLPKEQFYELFFLNNKVNVLATRTDLVIESYHINLKDGEIKEDLYARPNAEIKLSEKILMNLLSSENVSQDFFDSVVSGEVTYKLKESKGLFALIGDFFSSIFGWNDEDTDETPTQDWTCDETWYSDGECDCGCGVIDLDCDTSSENVCQYCDSCNPTTSCQEVVSDYENWNCETASCTDSIMNGLETGIDCGGDCPSCELKIIRTDCDDNNPCTIDSGTPGDCSYKPSINNKVCGYKQLCQDGVCV